MPEVRKGNPDKGQEKIAVTEKNIQKYLGKEKYSYQMANDSDEVGIVRGLAWTSVGGDTLQIEVNIMPGKGELMLTGQLGDVMKESAIIAMSYVRSVGERYQIEEKLFRKKDFHIHIPEGAVPKDGPSAGITICTAMVSALTGIPVRGDVAMTGEVTLRGRVLPIGGLKEKALAAYRIGIQDVIIPAENKKDLEDIPETVRSRINFIPVTEVDAVFKNAIVGV